MKIRKQFKFEASHVVRDCTHSRRCSFNIHGHSYIVEVILDVPVVDLDRAEMIRDFGGMRDLKSYFDKFDHAHILGPRDRDILVNGICFSLFVTSHNERWVEMSLNPSAEAMALLFVSDVCRIIGDWDLRPKDVTVRVHETATGYAEAGVDDILSMKSPVTCTFSITGPDYMEDIKNV